MSYSFAVTGATKADANRQIREKFDGIVASQPTHVADKEAVVVAAQSLVNILVEPGADDEVYVSMHGSLGWMSREVAPEFTNASASISVSMRKAAKAE